MTNQTETSPPDNANRPFSVLQRMKPAAQPSGRTPGLVTEVPPAERHATWLELFFDLVFVFTVTQLTHLFEENLTFGGMAEVFVLLAAVFWVWLGFAYYADQFDANDLPYRFLLMAGMFGVIIMSLNIHDAFHGGAAAFATCYVVLRGMVTGLYIRAYLFVEEARELVGKLLASYIAGVVLFAISIFVPAPACYALWILALIIEYGGSPVAYTTIRNIPAQISHMPERFGLFIIIVLGETVIAVAGSLEDFTWQGRDIIAGLCAFSVVVCMWWLYFNRADSEVINQAVTSGRNRDLLLSFVYGYSHVIIAFGAIGGAASYIAIMDAVIHGESASDTAYLIASLSVAIYILGTMFNHWASPHSLERRQILIRSAGAVILVVLSLTGITNESILLVVASAIILLVISVTERPLEEHTHSSTHDTEPAQSS